MIHLHITAEGQTEQNFANKVLAEHLAQFQVVADARSVLTSKDKRAGCVYRGGLLDYQRAKQDILTWMKHDNRPECRFTTMFDLYALPDDFPGFADAARQRNPYDRVRILEEAFAKDINDPRFIPYIQLHEFEALILAAPQHLDWEYIDHATPIANLIRIVGDQNPELINDGAATAPSKRILKEIPEYSKATAGVAVAQHIGLATLRKQCQHFCDWLSLLEQLASDPR
ncbi:MAG: DUF4276 family protein [Thermoguttaceae bacterium]